MDNKKALAAARTLVEYCEEQRSCQNCIFRRFAPGHWECNVDCWYLQDVLRNIEAKKKNHGYI